MFVLSINSDSVKLTWNRWILLHSKLLRDCSNASPNGPPMSATNFSSNLYDWSPTWATSTFVQLMFWEMCFGQFELKCRHTDTYGSLRKIKLIWTFLDIIFLEKLSIFHLSLSANHMPLHDENFEHLLVELEWKNLISECYFSRTPMGKVRSPTTSPRAFHSTVTVFMSVVLLVWPCPQLCIWSPLI